MGIDRLLPDPDALRLERVQFTDDQITITVRSSSAVGKCPLCGRGSFRIHSFYTRTLSDLPWHGRTVRLQLLARKFFCITCACPRRIFVERLPRIAQAHARTTCRLAQTREWIGFALGGEAGSRLADRLGMPVSPDTLLRTIRNARVPASPTPQALGVDDWAYCRGRRYGTLICDLERHRPMDMLDDREAETLAAWLRAHPGVRIITRDRAHFYKEGVSAGAPQAAQVTDRFHLMRNLRNVLFKILERRHRDVAVAIRNAAPKPPPTVIVPGPERAKSRLRQRHVPRPPTLREIRRDRRIARFRRVMELHHHGMSDRSIARQLGINRETVARYIRAGRLPERIPRRQTSRTDPFIYYLKKRWQDGCYNAAQLTRELRSQGFTGSYLSVRRRVAHWDRPWAAESADGSASSLPAYQPPSAKRLSWLILKNPNELDSGNRSLVDAVVRHCPDLGTTAALAREFATMIREHKGVFLDTWIVRAWNRALPRELRAFATGLKADYDAVHAALTTPWSNGQVEGQVNRLKLIKRQMYGRAKFDLLRQRVLHAG